MRLTDGEAADRIARQIKLRYLLHVFYAHIVKHRALIYAEQHLAWIHGVVAAVVIGNRSLAALEPAVGAVARALNIFARRGYLYALVKGHGNIRAEIRLDAHALLRPHEYMPPVNVGVEVYALLSDLAELCEREYLEPAAVGQYRAVPCHEFMQAAHAPDKLVAGSDVQMIGV